MPLYDTGTGNPYPLPVVLPYLAAGSSSPHNLMCDYCDQSLCPPSEALFFCDSDYKSKVLSQPIYRYKTNVLFRDERVVLPLTC
jgi:hypothetical protein